MKIEQGSGFLMPLLHRVTRGEIFPAAFQRPYAWAKDDVLALCESISKDYPIGAFVTWYPGESEDLNVMARRRLGPVEITKNIDRHTALLLDGQNRLASLAWTIYQGHSPLPADLSASELETWGSGQTLSLNLETQRIEFIEHNEASEGFRLPARVLVEQMISNKLVRARWSTQWATYTESQKDEGLKWLDKIEHCFTHARIVETRLVDATLAEARDAFLHVCRTGVPMSIEDFDAAVGWTPADTKPRANPSMRR